MNGAEQHRDSGRRRFDDGVQSGRVECAADQSQVGLEVESREQPHRIDHQWNRRIAVRPRGCRPMFSFGRRIRKLRQE